MKTTSKFLLLLAVPALVIAAADSSAPAASHVATIDLKKVFDGYYKVALTRKAIEKEEGDMDTELKNKMTEARTARDDYNKLKASQDDPMISDAQRTTLKAQTDAKLEEVKNDESGITAYESRAHDTLNLEAQHMMELLMKDVQVAVNAKAKSAGFSLVIDVSAHIANDANSPIVLYSSGENDITDEIVKQLNAAAPPASSTTGGGK
jgi:Skp family chaperone for outer membrane proteins